MFPEISIGTDWHIQTSVLYISLLCVLILFYVYKRTLHQTQFVATTAVDLTFVLMLSGFVGARLFHVIYENPEYYFANNNWSKIFYFWQGGFVFYGGFLLAIASGLLFVRWKNLNFWQWADFMCVPMALAYGLGRISCFLAGCCYGKASDLIWAVTFAWDPSRTLRHPTQIYALLWEVCFVWVLLLILEKKWTSNKTKSGQLFLCWLALHGLGRLLMEYYRDDFRGTQILNLSISSWVSLLLIAFALATLASRQRKPQ